MTVAVEDYDAVVAAINRKYKDSLHAGNEQIRLPSIPTGSMELDIAMGGGVPQGRWTRFYGGYGSTKTMTALGVIAEAQRMGLKCALYNIEKRYEASFAEERGIDTAELMIVEGTTVEEVGDKMESLLGVVHFHVLDSCTIAVSEDELAADVRDWRPGINARAWGKVFRRLNERFDNTDNTAILIDQMRTNFKTQGEDPAGGRVFDHQSSMSVLFRSSSWLWRREDGGFTDGKKKGETVSRDHTIDGQMSPDGREIKIRIEKSSVCRPFRTATLHYDLDTLKYDRIYEYAKAAKHYGVVSQPGKGAWFHYDNGKTIKKMNGEKQLRSFIAMNPELKEKIRMVALEAALA